jgi:hypothetical protein
LHDATDLKEPARHDVSPSRVYPSLQVMVHDRPDAKVDVQSPTPPLVTVWLASQVEGLQSMASPENPVDVHW